MATFEAKKLELTQINGGQEYEQGDFLQSDTINDVVEGTAYAQNVAEAANTKSNNAVSTANSANKTANAASEKVDEFDERITTAQNKANTAYDNAATAQSTANNATAEINKIKNGTTVVPNANHANNADNANLATKAQQDVNGNPINTTYATVGYVDDLVTEKQGTRVTVNNVNVAELSFTSDPQTQITAAQSDISDIVSGAQTVGKATTADSAANASQLGGVDAASYALKNGTYSTLIAGGNAVVDARTVNSPPSYYADRETCYEFKTTAMLGLVDYMPDAEFVLLTSKKGWWGDYIVYQEAVSAGYSPNSIRDSVKCYRYGVGETWGEWKVIFAVDPTKLAPSTANGWTQTTVTGTLPSAGVYLVSGTVYDNSIISPCIMVFDGTHFAAALSSAEYTFAYVGYSPNASQRWSVRNAVTGSEDSITNIYYKRIA